MMIVAASGAAEVTGPLDCLLRPRRIAVVGASRTPNTIGREIVSNLVGYGFTGSVFPVNPNADSIHSLKTYPTIAAVPDPVDMAVITVPKQHVLGVAEECGRAGVKGLTVISAGFREVGGEGVERERRLVEIVRRHGMRMVGPNCMGVLNADPAVSMNATFAPCMPPFGRAAFVSQSGAMGLSVLDYAKEYGIGITQFVSMGNKPDVSGNDLLLQWERDPTVGLVLMYVENFGNPRKFLEIARRMTRTKPIIVVKSGRSKVGARAASSHTGALAASDALVDAMMSQAGVIRAESVEELFDLAMAFSGERLPRSRRTAVLTNSGGPGILAADALERHAVELPELATETVERLRPLFPEEASLRNPLDMIASATPPGYRAALTALLDDPGVDSALAIFVPPLGIRQADVAEAIASVAGAHPEKPVLAVLMGREGLPQGKAELHEVGVPAYIFPESAARALSALCRHREWIERPILPVEDLAVDRPAAERLLAGARAAGQSRLGEVESLALLQAYGIPTARAGLARTAEEAVALAAAAPGAVAMKIVSPEIIHKTDVGGVRVGVAGKAEVRAAFEEIVASARRAVPGATIHGVLVQEMVTGGRETIAGVTREPSFGPLVMFGLGGIFVEVLRDVVFRVAPISRRDAADMIAGLRGARLLDSVRGAPPADRRAIEEVLLRLSRLATDFPEIAELDVNPLLAFPDGTVAVDGRVLLQPQGA
ncbi:MAG TPA: acetate--CoA ligase family protein [Gemmatimonadales bacterium]|nr:acetate--CoA ligase family protein [Gemmatimonadales bacterium]